MRRRPEIAGFWGRIIGARLGNFAAHLGTAHVEHPADNGRATLHGTWPRKDPGFPASAEPCALCLVHLEPGSPRLVGAGWRIAARAGFVPPHRRLYPRG